jgi:CcdB protein
MGVSPTLCSPWTPTVSHRLVGSPQWLSLCRHRVLALGVPYVLILQHHIVPSPTRIVAPVILAGTAPTTLLAPRLLIGSVPYRAMLLNMVAVAVTLLGDTVDAAMLEDNAVTDGLDAIFRGYPVGLPPN